ncbi:hypothetical protein [Romboutsia sp.]|uniref:hypothetical protein n=1 Tax=Romboutsia sp. TaxID=1965302 RepID=UPI002C190454|nr:hypothetical protein [Romboutsia sp.]HSQ89789.1 hypothetical protein [Romboutsia sp.]
MASRIKEYIEKEVKGLTKSGDSVSLKGVYPSAIEDVVGDFVDSLDLNGWQGDYWAESDEYKISGCMYYGTCTITLK